MQFKKTFILSSLIATIGFSAFAADKEIAKSDPAEEASLETVTCWEIMTLPEKDRDFALVLLYGYNAGKQNQAIQSGEKIAERIAVAGQLCGEKPDMKAVDAFRDAK